jgi:CRISPR-associated protein Cmr3
MTRQAPLSLRLTPVDTLMFRDGRPFNQGDPGAADAVSVFPPYPSTMTGMIRVWLARGLGWPGRGGWNENIAKRLGDGADWSQGDGELGKLRVSAPVVCRGDEALFEMPRSVLTTKGKPPRCVRLAPADTRTNSDLGEVWLPLPMGLLDGEALAEPDGFWITAAHLTRCLAGETPDAALLTKTIGLWSTEPRVGIGIDMDGTSAEGLPVSRLAARKPVDGALYMASHTRLANGVSLSVGVTSSQPGGVQAPKGSALSPAGGEHRSIEFSVKPPPAMPRRPDQLKAGTGETTRRYLVYHASPCLLPSLPGPGAPLACLPGVVVSACLGKARMIGGWNSGDRKGSNKGPIAMRPAIPAGSVWFLEAPASEASKILDRHDTAIGLSTAWGFGRIFIGTW